MLDLMRRKKRLKAVLWVVIVGLGLGMVLFFVPGANMGGSGVSDTVATVNGEEISVKEFWNTYRRLVQNFSSGNYNFDAETLKRLGLDRQALNALINIRVVDFAAGRMGLSVSPQEVKQALETHPSLQDRGSFIGVDRYKALLAANSIDVQEFEEGIRYSLLSQKLMNIISDSLEVTDGELRDEFQRSNQEAMVRYVLLKKEEYKKRLKPTEEDLRAYFEANKDNYRIKEERRARYLELSISELAAGQEVTDQEVQEHWNRTAPPETVDASHILFAVDDPAKESEVKAKAEEVLKRARAGEDFAQLAREYSDDKASAEAGGNLGPFPRGRMAREFEDAAFSMQPGQISDLVRTQFGYHIIKVLSHDIPSLQASREGIIQSIRLDKASELAKRKAAAAGSLVEKETSLEAIASALEVKPIIRETAFVNRDAGASTQGLSPSFVDTLFGLKEINAIGKPASIPAGFAIPQLIETKLPKPPDFAESRAEVERDYLEAKAKEDMNAAAEQLREDGLRTGSLEKAAATLGLKVAVSQPFKRDSSPAAEITVFTQFNEAAFELEPNGVSGPVSVGSEDELAVLQLISKTPFEEAAFQKEKPDLQRRLLARWRDAYFQAYIERLTEDLRKAGKIRVNNNVVEQVVGS